MNNLVRSLNAHIFTLSSYKMDNNKLLTKLKIQEIHMWHGNITLYLAFSRPLAQGQFRGLLASEILPSAAASFSDFLLQIEKIELTHSRQTFLIFLCLYLLLSYTFKDKKLLKVLQRRSWISEIALHYLAHVGLISEWQCVSMPNYRVFELVCCFLNIEKWWFKTF